MIGKEKKIKCSKKNSETNRRFGSDFNLPLFFFVFYWLCAPSGVSGDIAESHSSLF